MNINILVKNEYWGLYFFNDKRLTLCSIIIYSMYKTVKDYLVEKSIYTFFLI